MPDLTPGQERALRLLSRDWQLCDRKRLWWNSVAVLRERGLAEINMTGAMHRLTTAGIARKAALLERDAGGE